MFRTRMRELHHAFHGRRHARDPFIAESGPYGKGFGGRRGGRVFDHGDLRLVILMLIAEQPRSGYDIIKAIEDKVAGAYSPSPGVIYPSLTMLEELGYVTVSTGDGPKKLYTVTAEGSAFLAANRASTEAISGRIEQARTAFGQGRPPQIVRAVENLKMALNLRAARGGLTEDQARAIAAAIDAAALQIENL